MAGSIKAPSVAGSVAASNAGAAGLNLTKPGTNNPNPLIHGGMGQAERAFSAASTFLSGALAISASQFIGAPLKYVDPKFYDGYMAWTKESFAVLTTTITQWWAPTVVRVSGDESMKGQLYVMDDGTLKCNFPHRLVLMANHQLYTDWLYLWWIAYTNKMHGRIYIILKESLKNLPIFGWGAQFYNFIFLSRKWETDRYRFKRALDHLRNPEDPMWLLIFPEGTNLSAVTREKSAKWAEKSGVPDMKHQLLPRSTGLQFCLQELKASTNWLYDCTIAYEGVPKGMYGQDIFTLRSSFFEGRPPKSVNMYWRRFKIADIPVDNDEAFGRWLQNRWREKDYILEYFYKFSHFPATDAITALAAAEGKKEPTHAKMISTEVKGGGWDEFLSIFGPITTAAGAVGNIDMTELNPAQFNQILGKMMASGQINPAQFEQIIGKVMSQGGNFNPMDLMKLANDPSQINKLVGKAMQQANFNPMDLMNMGKAPMAATSQEAIRNALRAANAQKALPKSVIETLMREAPTTQQGMQQALMKSGHAEIAKKAAKAPAAKAQISPATQQNVAKAAQHAGQAIQSAAAARPQTAKRAPSVASSIPVGGEAANHRSKPAANTPAVAVAAAQKTKESAQKAMPLANMEAMVTRPISTLAMQTAGTKLRNAMADRAKEKGAALPGQPASPAQAKAKAAAVKQQGNGAAKAPAAGKSTTSQVGGGKKPAPLTAANLKAAGAAKPQRTPLGTQKYVDGKKV